MKYPHEAATAICEALGLVPSTVKALTIRVEPFGITVTVDVMPSLEDHMEGVTTILKEFELKPREDKKP